MPRRTTQHDLDEGVVDVAATASVQLQMTLGDVARLTHVQRPVVSVWRARSTQSDTPFPAPFAKVRGEERFDADAIVTWLESTRRGKNPNFRDDVGAFASPRGLSIQDDETLFNGLSALLCLKVVVGEMIAGLYDADLLDLAGDADPHDEYLFGEVAALGDRLRALAGYADALADATYNPAEAFEKLMAGRFRLVLPGHTAVALRDPARHLVASLGVALAADAGMDPPVFVDPTCGGSDVLVSLVRMADVLGNATMTTAAATDPTARLARRRLRAHGVHVEPLEIGADGTWAVGSSAVHLARYPSPGMPIMNDREILSAIDNIVLQMDDSHRAVVIAPASVLCDRIGERPVDKLRDSLLRLGRVRAIVRLPKGLVTTMPRQQLGLWVLGPAYSTVKPEDRWTAVTDLTDVELDSLATGELVGDLVAAMGDKRAVRAHAFRFVAFTSTRNLLVGRRDLVPRRRKNAGSAAEPAADLAVRIAEVADALDGSHGESPLHGLVIVPRAEQVERVAEGTLGEAITARGVRLVGGNRLDRVDLARGTVRVYGPEELIGSVPHGQRRIDRLTFSSKYPAGRYTEPGDVIFCTSPWPAALVDREGGAVVAAPAKVLRINRAGLLPQVLAGDINAVTATTKDWRAWPIRTVPEVESAALDAALTALDRERESARTRISQLDELTNLITRGVANGSLGLTSAAMRDQGD